MSEPAQRSAGRGETAAEPPDTTPPETLSPRTGRLRADPFATYLGMRWDDDSTVRVTIRPELLNSVGLLLGPIGFALVDYSMASTLFAQTSPDERIATINISINYLQSADHGEIVCRSRLQRRNRRLGILSSEVEHEDGRLLATAIGSFVIHPATPDARPTAAPTPT